MLKTMYVSVIVIYIGLNFATLIFLQVLFSESQENWLSKLLFG